MALPSARAGHEPSPDGLGHSVTTIANANIIALVTLAERRASAWEALVRLMEASGRTKIEVGIKDVREVAVLMWGIADGRKQAPQAEITPSSEGCAPLGNKRGTSAQEDWGTHRLYPRQANEAQSGSGRDGADRLAAQGIAAGTDETAQQAQPEGQEPGPKGCAQ